jgi:acetyltransferase-like isoleucine patch superfamily enzyme
VGAGSYVGEGAVVTENVPPASSVYGNPAHVVSDTGHRFGSRVFSRA